MAERISWLVLGVLIHLPPFLAFLRPSLLTSLYDVGRDDPGFALLHHRAALFGLVVLACVWATFDPGVRKLAVLLTALSMASFLIIYLAYGQPLSLQTIALVDAAGLPFLAYVGWKAFTS
ncbi:hypothetical protein SAMN02745824_2173 [Parasphingorhabdus marina DSM 22363]|uniref:Phosphopantetheine adenylyltransferase n=1 Tax=Parasphingorhabdus marina DSM 22363 TaxID=1123272 RepID=A0A1N6F0I3_9SPHN|nr:hypothetical protein [Parasphingorhabdus marina]SIN88749.1 hypothetical protein SAMN02745824_2173 [Parasphingorhabdus marina DSM 22363]